MWMHMDVFFVMFVQTKANMQAVFTNIYTQTKIVFLMSVFRCKYHKLLSTHCGVTCSANVLSYIVVLLWLFGLWALFVIYAFTKSKIIQDM